MVRPPLALFLLGTTLGGCGFAALPPVETPAAAAGVCPLEIVRADTLRLGSGADMFVQPNTIAASGAEVLLAGWPSYLHMRGPDGGIQRVPADTVLGAVLESGGGTRSVRSPIPGRPVGVVQALAHPDGGWDVVFSERHPFAPNRFPPPDTVARLWHGHLQNRVWRSVEEIPIPAGITLVDGLGSRLVRAGDTLAWALQTDLGYPRSAVVFRRRAGRWTSEVIPTGQASYISLAHSHGDGLLLAVARGPERGETGRMVLSVHRARMGWTAPTVVERSEEELHHPVLVSAGSSVLVAWYAGGGASPEWMVRVRRDADGDPGGTLVVDSSTSGKRAIALMAQGGEALWVIDHVDRADGRRELRLLRGSPGALLELGSVPNIFTAGIFGAAPGAEGEVLLSGPVLHAGNPVSYTMVLSARCRGERAADPAGE